MIDEALEGLPEKAATETLTEYAEALSDWYIQRQLPTYRKQRGQYFTPKAISEFMLQQPEVVGKKERLRVLDPGAGAGIFESACCEYVKSREIRARISFDLYENCPDLLPLLEHNMQTCKRTMARDGFDISYRIFRENFILANASNFAHETNNRNHDRRGKYDLVICNPPYHKLRKDSPEAIAMSKIVEGQPNLYVLFMAVAAKLLKDDGQLVILTPRSYCSGAYFSRFRKWFFSYLMPVRLHLFESRRLLENDNVLQEMVILSGIKNNHSPRNVVVSTSYREPKAAEGLTVRAVPIRSIVLERDGDIIIRIPTSGLDDYVAQQIDSLKCTLLDLGLRVSTGPVVPFRATEHLLTKGLKNRDFAPLIWMQNILDGRVIWPLPGSHKPFALRVSEKTERLRISNGNYVFIKRFSSKEGKRRINAGVLLKRWLPSKSISVENHVNYVHKVGGELTGDEAYGLAQILNSRLYNRYFQISNGSTQVDAYELNRMPMPSLGSIAEIGSAAKKLAWEDTSAREALVASVLGVDKSIVSRLVGC